MSQININRNISDPFYRYKMPKLIAKVEGRGNGIKTVIPNMSDIARSLQYPPAYPTKFLGIELGAQVILDEKNNRYIINGAHEDTKLLNLLYDFIDKFILCQSCGNPETYMETNSRRERIKMICKACGNQALITHNHKLNTYILKNPPSTEIKEDAISNRKAPEDVDTDQMIIQSNHVETTWYSDTSKEAVQSRMAELSERAAELTLNPDLEKSLEERAQMFQKFIKENLSDSRESIDRIFHESKRLDLGKRSILVISSVVFAGDDFFEQLEIYQQLFLKFCSMIRNQIFFIHSLEIIVSENRLSIKDFIKLVKFSYDVDIVEEDAILQWYSKRSNEYINDVSLLKELYKSVEPLINWLKTAEEESGDSEDNDEIVFVQNTNNIEQTVNKSLRYGPITVDNDDDDLNIDDI